MVINFKTKPLEHMRGFIHLFLFYCFSFLCSSTLQSQDAIGLNYKTQQIQKSIFIQYVREFNSKNSIQLGLGVSLNPIVYPLNLINTFDINYPIYFHENFILQTDYLRFFKFKNEFKTFYFTASLSYQQVPYRKSYQMVDNKYKLVLSDPMNTFQIENGFGLRLKTHTNFAFFMNVNAGLYIRKAKSSKDESLFLSSQFGFNYALTKKQK